jgi:hypothetical protein
MELDEAVPMLVSSVELNLLEVFVEMVVARFPLILVLRVELNPIEVFVAMVVA